MTPEEFAKALDGQKITKTEFWYDSNGGIEGLIFHLANGNTYLVDYGTDGLDLSNRNDIAQ